MFWKMLQIITCQYGRGIYYSEIKVFESCLTPKRYSRQKYPDFGGFLSQFIQCFFLLIIIQFYVDKLLCQG